MKLTNEQRNKELDWVQQKRSEVRDENSKAWARLAQIRKDHDRSFLVEMAIIAIALILAVIGLFLIP